MDLSKNPSRIVEELVASLESNIKDIPEDLTPSQIESLQLLKEKISRSISTGKLEDLQDAYLYTDKLHDAIYELLQERDVDTDSLLYSTQG